MTLKIVAYLGMWAITWAVAAGIEFHQLQAIGDGNFARKHYRSNLGVSVATGFLYGAIWPLGLPAAFCISGFAEHGIFTQRKVDR